MTLRFLPEVLERTRIKAGLSRDELAKAAGVARGTVFNAENGQQPRPGIAKALADALDIDVASLYAEEVAS